MTSLRDHSVLKQVKIYLVLPVAAVAAVLLALAFPDSGRSALISALSTDSAGLPADNSSWQSSTSTDGRYTAFASWAANLVPGDANGRPDIFVKDNQTGGIVMASTGQDGTQALWDSFSPTISGDGRYVAFQSLAANLVPGDTNQANDVFLKDLQTGAITRISTGPAGVQAPAGSHDPSISGDGRFVAFSSTAWNLVPGDANSRDDVFVMDTQTGTLTMVSVDGSGVQAAGDSRKPTISADGRFVGFVTPAPNLVPGDSNGADDVFVKDTQTGVLALASADTAGVPGSLESSSPSLSRDGRYVAFWSAAANLVPGDSNGSRDIFVKDMQTGAIVLASTDSAGVPADGGSSQPSLSADGHYVAFDSAATNLVTGDANSVYDIFLKDLWTGATTRLSTDVLGSEGNAASYAPSISADGSVVTFDSSAANLVPDDVNGHGDIFYRDTLAPVIDAFAPADGSWTAIAAPDLTVDYHSRGTITGLRMMVDGVECTVAWDQIHGACNSGTLAEGRHTARVEVSAGIHMAVYEWSFNIDLTAPVASNITPAGWTGDSAPTIGADLFDAGSGVDPASVVVSLDGTVLAGCTVVAGHVSCPAGALTDGTHDVSIAMSDFVGNIGTGAGQFHVDSVAPQVSYQGPAGTVYTTSETLSVSYSDALPSSGVDAASVLVTLDGAPLAGCTVTISGVSCPLENLAYGVHSVGGSVADLVANTAAISGTFMVGDNVAPQVSYQGPTGTVYTAGETLTVNYSEPLPSSGIDTAGVTVTLDGAPLAGCTVTATGVACPLENLIYGAHTVGGSVGDVAGNTAPITGGFTVGDNVAPQVSYQGPTGTVYTIGETLTVSYSDPFPTSGIDTAGVSVTLDGAPLTGCTVTVTDVSCPLENLSYGLHTVGGSVSDVAGNSTPITGSFTVGDNVAPQVSYQGPAGTVYTTTETLTVAYSDPLPSSGIDTASVSVSMDGAPLSGCTITAAGVTCPLANLGYGAHTVNGSVSDLAGNTAMIGGSFTVGDNVAPQVSYQGPIGTVYTTGETLNVSYTDPLPSSGVDANSVSVTLDGSPLAGCTVTVTGVSCPLENLSYGPHAIGGSVSDAAGNAASISGSFTVGDNVPPQVSYHGPTGTVYTTGEMLSISYSDPLPTSGVNTASVVITLDGAPLAGCTVTATGVTCPLESLVYGPHTIGGSVADMAGNTAPITGSFTVGDNQAPQVTYQGPSGTVYTTSDTLIVGYSDPLPSSGIDTASVALTLDGAPSAGCTVTATGVTCPLENLAYGPHAIGGNVSDFAGNVSTITGSFTVGDNVAPQVSYQGPTGTVYATSDTLAVSYSDPLPTSGVDTASVSVSMDGAPLAGCMVTTAGVTCPLENLTYGSHTISGSVSDYAGNPSAITGSFTVGDNVAPQASYQGPTGTIYTTGETLTVGYADPLPSSGIDTASVTVTLDGMPLTGCMVTTTGVTCPLENLAYGAHAVSGTVADMAGNAAPITGSFTVGDNVAPQVTYQGPTGTVYTTTETLTVSYSDPLPTSGVNSASASMTLDGAPLAGCTATATGISCPLENLVYGAHAVGGSVSDMAGNTAMISGSFTVGDNVGPQVNYQGPTGTVYTTSDTLAVSYSDPLPTSGVDTASVSVSMDGAPLAGCTATAAGVTCPLESLTYGSHAISGSVSDNAGNSAPISGSFTVGDNIAPQVSYQGPSGTFYTTSETLTVSYSDQLPSSGIDTASVAVTQDGIPLAGCTATNTGVTCPLENLTYGPHTIGCSVSDNAGNTAQITGSFTVGDNVAPQVSYQGPSGTVYTTGETLTVAYTDPLPTSGIDAASVSVAFDGAPLAGCTVTVAGVSCPLTNLTYGTHNIGGSVSDHAGNTASISGSFTVGDNIAPQVSYQGPTGTVYTTSETLAVSYSDPLPTSGVDATSVSVSMDGTPVAGCTVTATGVSCPLENLTYGIHTVGGSVSDYAGNTAAISGSFTVGDNVAPQVSYQGPSGTVLTTSETLTVSYSDQLPSSGIDTASVAVTLDGMPLAGCTATAAGVSCPLENLAYGSHTVGGSVADMAGNTAPITGFFTVGDNVAPQVSYQGPIGTAYSTSETLTVSYSDPLPSSGINTGSVAVTLDGTPLAGCDITAAGVTCPLANLNNGSHTVGGSVSDYAGNTAPITGSFTVGDNVAPQVAYQGPSATVYTTSETLTVGYSDPLPTSGIDTASVSVTLDGAPLAGCIVTASGVTCPLENLAYGSHAVSGTVADMAGNAAPITGSFIVGDNIAPQVSYQGPTGTVYTTSETLTISYTDQLPSSGIDTASVAVTLDGMPLAGCTVTATGVACPLENLVYGSHTVGGSVADMAGNTTTISGSFLVGDNAVPQVTYQGPAGPVYTTSETLAVSYSDPLPTSGIDTASVAITLDGAPLAGCTITASGATCTLENLAYGSHTIGGSVSDNAGNTAPISGSFTVGDNVAPQLSYQGPIGTVYASNGTVTVSYTDPLPSSGIDTASVAITLDGAPLAGCTITASGATCTLENLTYGPHTIGGSVKDHAGNTGTISRSFTVGDNVEPQLSYQGPTGMVYTASETLTVGYSDPLPSSGIDTASVTVTLDGAPLAGCTAAATGVTCPLENLSYGPHTVGGSVSDMAGNTAFITSSFTVGDNVAPQVTHQAPAGLTYNANPSLAASFTDPAPSSGIDPASASLSLNNGAPSSCQVTGDQIRCDLAGLIDGHYTADISVTDNAGNTGTASSSFDVDATAPQIAGILPAGWTGDTTPVIEADVSDSASGINAATMVVALDGASIPGCTLTVGHVTCPAGAPLAEGAHSIMVTVDDKVGNRGSAEGAFNVDSIAPAITKITPEGFITSSTAAIEANISDAGSGLNTASAAATMDGAPLTGCTATATHISCPVSGITEGHHTVTVTAADNAGNTASGSGAFDADLNAPSVTRLVPTGWTNDKSPLIEADLEDAAGSGINPASIGVTLDGAPMSGCSATATHVSCHAGSLAEGDHNVTITFEDNLGNPGSGQGTFGVDTAPPAVSSVTPSGTVDTASTKISVAFSDPAPSSGIDTAGVSLSLDGTPMSGCSVTDASIECSVTGLAYGQHIITGTVPDSLGNASAINGGFRVAGKDYWTWYDNVNASNWIMVANPASATGVAGFDIAIGRVPRPMNSVSGFAPGQVPPGSVLANQYPGVMDGPVEAGSTADAIVSQRILWGDSFEEVAGIDGDSLTDHYYWTWYDQVSPGYTNWVLVANPDATPAYYEIRIAGSLAAAGSLAPAGRSGDKVTPTFPGVMGGPVEVQAWTDSTKSAPARVIASQRVLSDYGRAFNEVRGIAATELSDHYLWTWYDHQSPGASNWVLVANPGSTQVTYEIRVAGVTRHSGTLAPAGQPGDRVTPTFPGLLGGPVEVIASGNVIASQRVTWGASFEEVPGTPAMSVGTAYHWTWYDYQSAGAQNWVLVANTEPQAVSYQISVAGVVRHSGTLAPAGQPGDRATPIFPGLIGGPVEVSASGNVLASQRVIWRDHFNEVVGTQLR